MMTFRTLGLSLGAVAACSAAFSVNSPAHAASLAGQTLSFTGSARLEIPEAVRGIVVFP